MAEDGRSVTVQAVDDMPFPARFCSIERLFEEFNREFFQLFNRPGRRKFGEEDLAFDIEIGVVFPRRVGKSEWHEQHALPIPGNGWNARSDVLDEALERDLAFVDAERADMQGGV